MITVETETQPVVDVESHRVRPSAEGETPQRVFDKKKVLFRFDQIIWYILGFIEVLLAFRFVLKLLGANQQVGFTRFIYSITGPFASPFSGILGISSAGSSTIEWSTLIAAMVYLTFAWGIIHLLELFFPITPKDV